jgi:hypothetical protein
MGALEHEFSGWGAVVPTGVPIMGYLVGLVVMEAQGAFDFVDDVHDDLVTGSNELTRCVPNGGSDSSGYGFLDDLLDWAGWLGPIELLG